MYLMTKLSAMLGQPDSGVPYKLREYKKSDYEPGAGQFLENRTCFVCGHHLPIDQHLIKNGKWMHSDFQICKALGPKTPTIERSDLSIHVLDASRK